MFLPNVEMFSIIELSGRETDQFLMYVFEKACEAQQSGDLSEKRSLSKLRTVCTSHGRDEGGLGLSKSVSRNTCLIATFKSDFVFSFH